jgi:malonyl-CoA O-methyltransferase
MTEAAHIARVRPQAPYSRFAAVYDRTIGWPAFQRTRRQFARLAQHYGIRFTTAADIGCGTGLFARYLRDCHGARVYAVDLSPEMLGVAARNCAGAGVRLLRQDIRRLCLPEPVELITSNFDALNHLTGRDDLRVAFRRIAANLRPGGHLYFDLVTPCRPLGGRPSYVRSMQAEHRRVTQRFRWHPGRGVISAAVVIDSFAARPLIEWHCERVHSFADVGRWLLDAGLIIRGVHDADHLDAPRACPARIVVIAQKHAA